MTKGGSCRARGVAAIRLEGPGGPPPLAQELSDSLTLVPKWKRVKSVVGDYPKLLKFMLGAKKLEKLLLVTVSDPQAVLGTQPRKGNGLGLGLHSWFFEDTECGPDLYHMAGDSWEKGLNI